MATDHNRNEIYYCDTNTNKTLYSENVNIHFGRTTGLLDTTSPPSPQGIYIYIILFRIFFYSNSLFQSHIND